MSESISLRPEGLIATHDGWIWPRARAQMQDRRTILLRMGHDLKLLQAAQEIVSLQDLRDLGWREEQLKLLASAVLKSNSAAPTSLRLEKADSQNALLAELVHGLASGLAALMFIAGLYALLLSLAPSGFV